MSPAERAAYHAVTTCRLAERHAPRAAVSPSEPARTVRKGGVLELTDWEAASINERQRRVELVVQDEDVAVSERESSVR
jgi:hypothetical protein